MQQEKNMSGSGNLLEHVLDHKYFGIFELEGLKFGLTQHLLMLIATGVCLLAMVSVAARRRVSGNPSRLAALVEGIILVVRNEIVYPAMGEKYGRKYLNFFLTITSLILASNILGLIPALHIGHFAFGGTATGNFWINLGLASIVYIVGIACVVWEHGLGTYLGSFLPPGVPWILAPLIWFIEWAGMLMKHIVLAIRLTANMMAGHLVLFATLGIIAIIIEKISSVPAQLLLSIGPILLALAIFLLELLVAFIQTAIFAILSAIFFGMAVNPHH